MRNGYVIPPRNKRRQVHRKSMSFSTYLQLRLFLASEHSKPSLVVTSHDRDKMTYLEAYHAFNIVKRASEEDLRLISGLISLLYTKHVINRNEEKQFVDKYLRGLENG